MRDLIKTVIAFAFMAGSFWIGKNTSQGKCAFELKESSSRSEIDSKLIRKLRDSIGILNITLEKEMAKNENDSIMQVQDTSAQTP